MSIVRPGVKFRVNPVIRADRVSVTGFRFKHGEVYDSGELRIPEKRMAAMLQLKMGTVNFFLRVDEENVSADDPSPGDGSGNEKL